MIRMLKKSASAKTVSREAFLVKRTSQGMKISACERRDTRDERRTKRTAFLSILRDIQMVPGTFLSRNRAAPRPER
jgi:hypothetical protein